MLQKYILYLILVLSITACVSIRFERRENLEEVHRENTILYNCELALLCDASYPEIVFPIQHEDFPSINKRSSLNIYNNGKFGGISITNAINGDCNIINDSEIIFSNIQTTLVNCGFKYPFDEDLTGNQLEGMIMRNLALADSYCIKEDTLILKENGRVSMKYVIIKDHIQFQKLL